MPLNKHCIGRRYSAPPSGVTLEALQNYARACNDPNPRFFDPATQGGIIAPPMFAVVLTWLPLLSAMTDPELRADLLRLLHSAQDMEFLAPIRPDDVITSNAMIASIESAANGETMAVDLEAQNQRGEIVNRTTFTVLIRGRRESTVAAESRSAASAATQQPPLVLSITQTIDSDQTFRYAEASGDRNPIHVDRNVARMAGLPGIIVHGLCTMAFASKVMVDNLCAGDPARLRRLTARFSRPVFPGQTITTRIWPSQGPVDRQIFSYETYNPDGLAVIREGLAEIIA
jgi:acyl dehydratase